MRTSATIRRRTRLAAALFVLAVGVGAPPADAQTRYGLRFAPTESGVFIPALTAAAAVVFDPETGAVLWENGGDARRPIASLTKMMSAVVFLETSPDLSREVTVTESDTRRSFNYHLRPGDRITAGDLLHLMMIPSDNAAARAIARTSVYGAEGFIDAMNRKARELGLMSTVYEDPSGLDRDNVSSAYDMARLVSYASGNELLARIMQLPRYTARAGGRAITVRSTNELVRGGDYDVVAGKTGYIRRAGHCLATLLRLPESGKQVAVVVLGAPSSSMRFREARGLYAWVRDQTRGLFDDLRALD